MKLDTKKIKTKISRYKSSLKKEKSTYGAINDGYGKRYLIGPLHLIIGENKKAIEYFNWFEQEFDDDYGEPFQMLSWVIALFHDNQIPEAIEKLVDLIEMNLYIVPFILGEEYHKYDIWHGSNMSQPDYLDYWEEEYDSFINDDFKAWLKDFYHKKETKAFLKALIKFKTMLNDEARPEKRKIIIANEDKLLKDFKDIIVKEY